MIALTSMSEVLKRLFPDGPIRSFFWDLVAQVERAPGQTYELKARRLEKIRYYQRRMKVPSRDLFAGPRTLEDVDLIGTAKEPRR